MKVVVTTVIFGLLFINCTKDKQPYSPLDMDFNEFRKTAYNILSDEDKETIYIDWIEAKVEYCTLVKENKLYFCVFNRYQNDSYRLNMILFNHNVELMNNQLLVVVTFFTRDDGWLGPIVIIVDPFSKKNIGYFLRD